MDISTDEKYGMTRQRLAIAICIAERGFSELYAGQIMRNNPGDIKGPDGRIEHYPSIMDGWSALKHEIDLIFAGKSHYYNTGMSIQEFGVIWTGNDNPLAWANTVAGMLGVDVTTNLDEL